LSSSSRLAESRARFFVARTCGFPIQRPIYYRSDQHANSELLQISIPPSLSALADEVIE